MTQPIVTNEPPMGFKPTSKTRLEDWIARVDLFLATNDADKLIPDEKLVGLPT